MKINTDEPPALPCPVHGLVDKVEEDVATGDSGQPHGYVKAPSSPEVETHLAPECINPDVNADDGMSAGSSEK